MFFNPFRKGFPVNMQYTGQLADTHLRGFIDPRPDTAMNYNISTYTTFIHIFNQLDLLVMDDQNPKTSRFPRLHRPVVGTPSGSTFLIDSHYHLMGLNDVDSHLR